MYYVRVSDAELVLEEVTSRHSFDNAEVAEVVERALYGKRNETKIVLTVEVGFHHTES